LPFTLPAALMALAGGSIAVLITRMAGSRGLRSWSSAARGCGSDGRSRNQGQIARSTLSIMVLATLLATTAASWTLIEPVAFNAMGIVKKKAVDRNE
jgi:hypothetical protein